MGKNKIHSVPADQSLAARRKRFYQDGGCPIHGVAMGQSDGWYGDDPWGPYTIISCGRNGCPVEARAFSPEGPWDLPPEFAHLIENESARAEGDLSSVRPRRNRPRKVWPIPDDQSPDARRSRLSRGLCPVHAMQMTQVDRWFPNRCRKEYTIVGCDLNDCQAKARMYSPSGPWELLDECADLLRGL